MPQQSWYAGGYRANIVTYAFAKVIHDAEQRKRVIDLDKIWTMQRVPVNIEKACLVAAEAANGVVTNPPAGIRNMSEWAKKQGCWAELAKLFLNYEADFGENLIEPSDAQARKKSARRDRELTSGIEAQSEVVLQGGEYWSQLLDFGRSINKLNGREQGILRACTLLPDKIPSEKQSSAALAIAGKLEQFY